MKTKTKTGLFISSLILLIGGTILSPSIAYALPYGTETYGPEGALVTSQPSYVPENRIRINNPNNTRYEDMCIDDDERLYIVDNENKKIIIRDVNDETYLEEITEYTYESVVTTFNSPTGVTVNDNYIYVADGPANKILVFNRNDLSFDHAIVRPDSILVGSATKFIPIKVRADNSGNIYAVLESGDKGVMQLDNVGNFISYIGANHAEMSITKRIQEFFGIKDTGLNVTGKPVTNICLDNDGLLYTITNGDGNTLKKLNTTGNAILTMNYNDPTTVSAFVDNDGNIFSVQSSGTVGYVTVYDSYGSLLFRFGGKSDASLFGALINPVAACMDKKGHLIVLQKESNIICEYAPTYFANLVFKAVSYYKDGIYVGEAEEAWNELLKYNSKFILAYKALARASMKKGDYNLALKQFKLAEDKAGYSDAFWQIRDNWIRNYLGWVILPIVFIVIAYIVLKLVDKKKPALFAKPKAFMGKVKNAPVVNELGLMFTFMRNPRETIYEIKYKKRARVVGAIVLYVLFAVIQILKIYLTGYLFNNVGRSDGLRTIIFSTAPLFILVLCNYYVSSVRDGEGKLKDIFISFIYALSPYIVFSLPLFLISNVITYNEQAIYFMVVGVVYAWCGINIVLTIMELHDYSLGKALINILLTLVCFVLALAFVIILYVLGYQLFSYLGSVIKEATIR